MKAFCSNELTILQNCHEQSSEGAKQAQLHISHPNGRAGLLQHLLDPHASKATGEARQYNRTKSFHLIIFQGLQKVNVQEKVRLGKLRVSADLHHHNAKSQEETGAPLYWPQPLAQHQNTQACSCNDFHLVQNLLYWCAQLCEAVKHEIILKCVDQRWHCCFGQISTRMSEMSLHTAHGSGQVTTFVDHQKNTGDELDHFRVENHSARHILLFALSVCPFDEKRLSRSLKR
mmetsp:Transcript_73607/g.117069  ORF Transcript_73607/g.117069 Transcript_73607/m.117069 type:complete len:231 (+) Transcript_73607:523-1215(+)